MSTEIEIDVIKGHEGDSIYINDTRVAGSKPWSGGRNILHLKTKVSNISPFRNHSNPHHCMRDTPALNGGDRTHRTSDTVQSVQDSDP